MRFGKVFYITVVILCIVESLRLWGITPAQMAAHFNAEGSPDRFVPKAEFFWFEIQTMSVVIVVSLIPQLLLFVLPAQLINLPNRDYWLAPAQRMATVERLRSFLATMFGILLLAVHAGFEISAYANLHTPIVFNAPLMFGIMTASFLTIGLLVFQLAFSFRLPSSSEIKK